MLLILFLSEAQGHGEVTDIWAWHSPGHVAVYCVWLSPQRNQSVMAERRQGCEWGSFLHRGAFRWRLVLSVPHLSRVHTETWREHLLHGAARELNTTPHIHLEWEPGSVIFFRSSVCSRDRLKYYAYVCKLEIQANFSFIQGPGC